MDKFEQQTRLPKQMRKQDARARPQSYSITLADIGAEVMKVEQPVVGDSSRSVKREAPIGHIPRPGNEHLEYHATAG